MFTQKDKYTQKKKTNFVIHGNKLLITIEHHLASKQYFKMWSHIFIKRI